jgi:hypothetical protein
MEKKILEKRKLAKKAFTVLTFVLLSSLIIALPVHSQTSPQTIHIRADGSVYPASAPIQRNGDTYILTGNLYAPVVIESANIVFDGAGYALVGDYNGSLGNYWIVGQGPYQDTSKTLPSIGIDVLTNNVGNLTIKNLEVKKWGIGIYVWSLNNTVKDNVFADNIVGVLLGAMSTTITNNYIARNSEGVFFGIIPPENVTWDIVLSGNSFLNNTEHLSGCQCKDNTTAEPIHTWDNGSVGNFWSNYNGTDINGDGFGDTPYTVDNRNMDRFPLMQPSATAPIATATSDPNLLHISDRELFAAVGVAAIGILAVVLGCIFTRKRIKKG